MHLIDIDEALQAVDNRVNELKAHEIFRNKADIIDVLGVKKWINNISPIEAIPKDQYEARYKADLVAMLTEIQLEIEEIKIDVPFGFEPVSKTSAFYEGVSASSKVIRQKINELKGESEEVR